MIDKNHSPYLTCHWSVHDIVFKCYDRVIVFEYKFRMDIPFKSILVVHTDGNSSVRVRFIW